MKTRLYTIHSRNRVEVVVCSVFLSKKIVCVVVVHIPDTNDNSELRMHLLKLFIY